jgi:hypothetical protein
MTSFLTALMLRFHLVFIGCSLEDEIIRLRRELTVRYNGFIPVAYALLQGTDKNLARESWLRNLARIESILYSPSDEEHTFLDMFLQETAAAGDVLVTTRRQERLDTIERIRQLTDLRERLRVVGIVNQQIVRWVAAMPDQMLYHGNLINPARTSMSEAEPLLDLSADELTYRALFLVATNLLAERESPNRERLYAVPEQVAEALIALGPPVMVQRPTRRARSRSKSDIR